MKRIYKYPIEPDGQPITMPAFSEILAVQTQRNAPFLWALVDTDEPPVQRTFATYGTGHDLPDDPGRYIGTFQLEGGALVFHVFEVL